MSVDNIRPVLWQDNKLVLLDQRYLPGQEINFTCSSCEDTITAIREMVVRGAPAIGVTAAFGVVLAARQSWKQLAENWKRAVEPMLQDLSLARPTAVNLVWAIDQMRKTIHACPDNENPEPALLKHAMQIMEDDIAANHKMGELGAALITKPCSVLTHCNAGALATAGYGTALGVIRSGYDAGMIERVYADETRPWLQGARLTAWEMVKEGIPVSLLADGAAPWLMKQGKVAWVIVGSDRIAANGDVANKIGTYSAAIAARHHGIGFMVVAPTTTIDMSVESGDFIPIEVRASEELLQIAGTECAASGSEAWNPVFDVTPASLVDAIVTEKGVVLKPDAEKIRDLMSS